MILQSLSSSRVADCSPKQRGRTLSDRQIQPLHIRSIQFPGVLGIAPSLLPFPCCSNSGLTLYFDHAIIPALFDHLTVETRCSKHPLDDRPVELESICSDQRKAVVIQSFNNISKQIQRVSVTSFPNDGGRPESRANFQRNENPDPGLLFPANQSTNLIGLQFGRLKPVDLLTIESTAALGGSFHPAIHRVPGNLLRPGNCGFVATLYAEGCNLVHGSSAVLQSMINSSRIPTESFPAAFT